MDILRILVKSENLYQTVSSYKVFNCFFHSKRRRDYDLRYAEKAPSVVFVSEPITEVSAPRTWSRTEKMNLTTMTRE